VNTFSLFSLLIFSLLSFSHTLFAKVTPLIISPQNTQIQSIPHMAFMIDRENKIVADEVLKSKQMKPATKSTMGIQKSAFWTRLVIVNPSDSQIKLVFTNPRAGVDYIDVYLFSGSNLEKSYQLGDMRPMANRPLKHPDSNFTIELAAKESKTIITRLYTYGTLDIGWHISSEAQFLSESMDNLLIKGFIFGFILALISHNLVIYHSIREKIYLIYTGFLLCIILSQASILGIMYYWSSEYLNLFFITYCAWFFAQLYMVFLYLIFIEFYKIKQERKTYYLFTVLILFHLLVLVYYSLSYFDPTILQKFSIVTLIALIESTILTIYSIISFFRKKQGALEFMVGQILYIFVIFYYILTLQGVTETSILSKNIIFIGLFFLSLFISFALNVRLREIREQNRQLKIKSAQLNKFSIMGATISYASHQWKRPLAQLSSLIVKLQALVEFKPEQAIKKLPDSLNEMETKVLSLNQIISDINRLFDQKKSISSTFNLTILLQELKEQYYLIAKQQQISIKVNADKDIQLMGDKKLFVHAMSNIVQNAIDAFIDMLPADHLITINAYEQNEDRVFITIEDNAGGILIKPIESIFENYTSSKAEGFGLGLTLANNIIISKFNGSITVKNINQGAQFTIEI